tara:strand:- start:1620 stop:1934 length:315 start_codon:yes stop_codon:yes gene_type:complete
MTKKTEYIQAGHYGLDVGEVLQEDELNDFPTGRGRKYILHENSEWVSEMNKADGNFVVLEKLQLSTRTKSRIANRVVKYNKIFTEYEFKSKSIGDFMYFLGRAK